MTEFIFSKIVKKKIDSITKIPDCQIISESNPLIFLGKEADTVAGFEWIKHDDTW